MAAAVNLAPRGCGFEQDCTRCDDPELRKQWGCDAPAEQPVTWLEPCPFCSGGSASCKHCTGTNRVPIFRCPHALATARERDVLMAASLVEQGMLPDPGGWQDQAATFVEAFPLATNEIAHWREVRRELAQRQAESKRRR